MDCVDGFFLSTNLSIFVSHPGPYSRRSTGSDNLLISWTRIYRAISPLPFDSIEFCFDKMSWRDKHIVSSNDVVQLEDDQLRRYDICDECHCYSHVRINSIVNSNHSKRILHNSHDNLAILITLFADSPHLPTHHL